MVPAPLTTHTYRRGEGSALRQVRYVEAVTVGLLLPLPAAAPALSSCSQLQLQPSPLSSLTQLLCLAPLLSLLPTRSHSQLLFLAAASNCCAHHLPSTRVSSSYCRACCWSLIPSFCSRCCPQILLSIPNPAPKPCCSSLFLSVSYS